MASRRDFLGALAGVPSLSLMSAAGDPYVPCGFIGANESPGANDIERVELDGVPLLRVFELNDVEGWVRHYPDPDTEPDLPIFRPIYREGVVRVFWKPRAQHD